MQTLTEQVRCVSAIVFLVNTLGLIRNHMIRGKKRTRESNSRTIRV